MTLDLTLDADTVQYSPAMRPPFSAVPWSLLTLRGALAATHLPQIFTACVSREPLTVRLRQPDHPDGEVVTVIVRSYEVTDWDLPTLRTLSVECSVTPAVPHTAH